MKVIPSSSRNSFPWAGFDKPPTGSLFEQVVDVGGSMGFAYERSVGFTKPLHVHDRAIFVFPRNATVMAVGVPHLSTVFRVTDEDVLVVPAETPHDDRHVSQVYDTFALLPALRLIDEALGGARDPFASCSCAQRSPLLTELVATYFEERIRANLRPEPRREWIEKLIISEVAKAVFGDSATSKQNSEAGDSRLLTSSIVERALRFIEANLFGNVDALAVARAAAASRSSLLRHFRHEVGESLGAYVQGRRLDEAQRLFERRGLTVAEVALLVGYQNAGAFAEAYRRRFGVPPSSRHTSP